MQNLDELAGIFRQTRTIAIVGLSANPSRASHEVARYLADYFTIIPVNPNYDEVLGLKCYPDLEAVPEPIDMIDVFQRSEQVSAFVDPAIAVGARCFWMQLGISHGPSAAQLEASGLTVVQDKCTKVEHARARQAGLLD